MEKILRETLQNIQIEQEKERNTEPLKLKSKYKRKPRLYKQPSRFTAVSFDIAARMTAMLKQSCKMYFTIDQFPDTTLRVVKVVPSKRVGALIIECTMYTIDPLTVEVDMHHKFSFYFI